MTDLNKAVKLIVRGRVQKVGYRAFVLQKAIELSVKGYVRNQSDGSVLVYAMGTNLQLDEFLQWCQSGSPLAKVNRLEVQLATCNDRIDFRVE